MTSRSEFYPVRGLRYHLRRWGDPAAAPVLLLHGWLDVSATWEYVARGLVPEFQVLAPDWRGFGHTQWPQDGYWFQDYVADLEALIAALEFTQPLFLVGHSMGAQIGSLYAGLRPERVRAFACLDGLFLPDMPAELAPKRFIRWLDELRDPPKEKTYSSFHDLAARIQRRHPRLSAERALFIARCWAWEDGHGKIRLMADPKHEMHGPGLYKAEESIAIWKNITAPTLFLDAGESQFPKALGNPEMERRRACFRKRREDVIAGAGHMLHFDAPEETARRVAAFLAAC